MSSKINHHTQIVSFKEFRLNAVKYIDALSKGSSFLVVKRSRPIFRLEPLEEQWEEVADFTKISKKGVSAKTVLASL